MKGYLTKVEKIAKVFTDKTEKEVKRLANKLNAMQVDYIYNQYCKRNRLIGERSEETEKFYRESDLQYISK